MHNSIHSYTHTIPHLFKPPKSMCKTHKYLCGKHTLILAKTYYSQ